MFVVSNFERLFELLFEIKKKIVVCFFIIINELLKLFIFMNKVILVGWFRLIVKFIFK